MDLRDPNRNRREMLALCAACSVLQLALAPQVSILGGTPNFMVALALLVTLRVGGRTGVLTAFCGGMLSDLTSPSPVGLLPLLLVVTCFALGASGRNRIGENPASGIRLMCGACVGVMLVYGALLLVLGQQSSFVDAVLRHGLASGALTALVAAAIALVLMRRSSGGGMPSTGLKMGKTRRLQRKR